MKKITMLSLLVLCGISHISAQTDTSVAPCNGSNNTKPLDLAEKSVLFNQAGINLNKYDWSNPNLNCHINEGISHVKTAKTLKSLAWVLMSSGTGVLLGGIMGSSSSSGGSDGGAGTFIGMGLVMIGGSVPLFIGGGNNKKKSNYHISQVLDYYQKKGW